MKIKGKQTEKSRETSIKTADTMRLSASLHNSVFCRGSAWAHYTYVRFLIQLLRNFLEKFSAVYIFFLPLLSTVDNKGARRILRQANLLAWVIELNNEILFPWWPCTIESRAPIHRITSKHEVNQVEKKINLCDFIAPYWSLLSALKNQTFRWNISNA